jgi:hypothetical protein
VVFWVSASIQVPRRHLAGESAFWGSVVGGPLPEHLAVRAGSGTAEVGVDVHDDEHPPVVPAPAAFPGVRRSRVYQVCLDIPGPRFESEADGWARLSGGRVEVLDRRPEFAWLRVPGGPRPLDVLLQRLDSSDGPVGAHLDVGTPDRAAEVRRHLALGATPISDEEFWTVLADPAGLPYCVTDRDPATGSLA